MTELIDLIAMAFDEGCGTKLDSVLRSSRYHTLVNRYRNAPHQFRSRGESGVVDMGLWAFNTGVNTIGLELTRSMPAPKPAFRADSNMMALIEMLGRKIIKTSASAIPAYLTELAKDWKDLDAVEQKARLQKASKCVNKTYSERKHWTKRLPPTFTVEGGDVEAWLTDLSWFHDGDIEYKVEEVPGGKILKVWELSATSSNYNQVWYEPTDSLPRYFFSESAELNCLGLAMLLCGFAELTGAEYYIFSYIEHRASQVHLHDIMQSHRDAQSMDEGEIPLLPGSREGIQEELPKLLENWSTRLLEDFHYALVMQLSDGSWMQMDPYQKTASALSEEFAMDDVTSTLKSYQDLYPGMSLICDDGGVLAKALEDVASLRHEAQIRAARIVAPLHCVLMSPTWASEEQDAKKWGTPLIKMVYNPDYNDYRELLSETDDALWFETIIRQVPEIREISYDRSLFEEFIEDLLSKYYKCYEKLPREVWDKNHSEIFRALFDSATEDFFEETLEETLLRVHGHCISIVEMVTKPVTDAIWGGLEFPHPVIEVMNPAFGLALALLNQLRCWTDNDLSGTVLLSYGASQQYWHDAASIESADIAELRHIEDLVRMLPHHYPIVQNKLDYFERMREVTNGNVREAEGHQGSNDCHGAVQGRGARSQPQPV